MKGRTIGFQRFLNQWIKAALVVAAGMDLFRCCTSAAGPCKNLCIPTPPLLLQLVPLLLLFLPKALIIQSYY